MIIHSRQVVVVMIIGLALGPCCCENCDLPPFRDVFKLINKAIAITERVQMEQVVVSNLLLD